MNRMADNDDDDAFFDDDFPEIPDDELQRLEQNAISFTQREGHYTGPQHSDLTHKKPPVSRAQAHTNTLGRRPPYTESIQQKSLIQQAVNPSIQYPDSTDGTIFDEDGLPLVVEERPVIRPQKRLDETAQREQWRANRFAQPSISLHGRGPSNASSGPHPPNHASDRNAAYYGPGAGRPTISQNGSSVSAIHKSVEDDALRAKIAELVRERDELTNSLHKVQEEVYTRRGEIMNVRAKLQSEGKTYQRQLQALQKLKQEDTEKHTASLQAINAENAKVASEIQFLKQELKEESRKAQAYQRQLKERPLTDKPPNITTTPKRNRSLRDGFDDEEILLVSPVKSGGRKSKQNTPTANRKRKQPANTDASVPSLTLRLSAAGIPTNAHNDLPNSKSPDSTRVVLKDHNTKRHLRLIQKVTNLRPGGGHETLIEQSVRFSFPSEPQKTFGTLVVDAIAKLDGTRLPGDLVQIFIDLWSRALKEKYYLCISVLSETISFILDQDPCVVDKAMLNSFLPLLEATITINATARFKLMQKDYLNNPGMAKPTIDPNINNTACLDLLHTVACLSSDSNELIDLFWRSISTEFVLMILNGFQTISDITVMLQILATSILPGTFSNICPVDEQNRYETYTCDRVCYLLSQLARPDVDKPPYPQRQLCALRQESLNLLAQLCIGSSPNPHDPSSANNHGTTFLANHPNAIGRLVRCIHDELATAYHMTPTQHLHIQLVNTAVRILHFVLFSPAGSQIVWQTKFNAANGGAHKFRVAMARLVYAEGSETGIDAGITENTMRMAREMLEPSITPDEVDDLVRVFEGEGNENSSRRASAIGSTQR